MKVLMKSKNCCSRVLEQMNLENRRMWLMNGMSELTILEAGQFRVITRPLDTGNTLAAERQKMVRIGAKTIFAH